MAILWLVALVGLPVFLLGLFVWAVLKHFFTAEIPPALQQPFRFRLMHIMFLYIMTLGTILEKLGICSMPTFVRFLHDNLMIKKNPGVVVTNLHFGTVPVRLFQPKAKSCGLRRGIIFFHGGGALFGSLDCYHSLCSFLARETDSVLLAVGYRKLPYYHYPVIAVDCWSATVQFLKDPKAYGVDPSRVVVCGESLGGGTAAVVSQRVVGRPDLPRIRAQVLIYPVVQSINLQLPSFHQNKHVPLLTQNLLLKCVFGYLTIDFSWKDAMLSGAAIPPDFWKKYKKWLSSDNIPKRFRSKDHQPECPAPFNEAAYLETRQRFSVENAPLMGEDKVFAQLPEAFLVSCEYDMLRDDTLLYKKRLEDNGVPVTWYHVEDAFHGCIILLNKKPFSFPCATKIMNSVVHYIKGI